MQERWPPLSVCQGEKVKKELSGGVMCIMHILKETCQRNVSRASQLEHLFKAVGSPHRVSDHWQIGCLS